MGCFLLFYVYKSLADVDPHILSLHTDIKYYMKALTPLFFLVENMIFFINTNVYLYSMRERERFLRSTFFSCTFMCMMNLEIKTDA